MRVYTLPDYRSDGAPYGFLLLLDGWFYINLIPAPIILDNLRAEGRLPSLAAIMVGGVFDKTRQRDLACHPPFMDFLTREPLPWARKNYRLIDDPAQATRQANRGLRALNGRTQPISISFTQRISSSSPE